MQAGGQWIYLAKASPLKVLSSRMIGPFFLEVDKSHSTTKTSKGHLHGRNTATFYPRLSRPVCCDTSGAATTFG